MKPMKQYVVHLAIQLHQPTTAEDELGAATLARAAVELAFANLPSDQVKVEVIGVYDG